MKYLYPRPTLSVSNIRQIRFAFSFHRLLLMVSIFSLWLPINWTKAQAADIDSLFFTPEILRSNVAFWKKVYTQVSLNEGYIHDNEYPLIIYKKIEFNGDESIIKAEKERVKLNLQIMNTQPESTWTIEVKEIHSLFKQYAPDSAYSGAETRIRFQQGQKDRFKQGLYRSGMFLDTIRKIFTEYNLPLRLIYLPHVESSFNYEAYSKVGAAGLWQFMRGTGKQYLTINYSIDQRRDPILSTVAAAQLLKHNFEQLNSWPLAITAYNHGLNGMLQAVNYCGTNDIGIIIQKHKSKLFQFASRNFYSCFLAASEIAMNHEEYFPSLIMAPPIQYQNLSLDYSIRPQELANLTGISIEELARFNPAIRPVIFTQNRQIPKGALIRLPAGSSTSSIELALNTQPESSRVEKTIENGYYEVKKGDNLYTIAKDLNIKAEDLKSENQISKNNQIYVGQVLRIPEKSSMPSQLARTMPITPETTKKTVAPPAIPKFAQLKTKTDTSVQSVNKKPESTLVAKTAKQPTLETSEPASTAVLLYPADTVREGLAFSQSQLNKFDASVYNLTITLQKTKKNALILVSVDETIGHYAEWLGIPSATIKNLNRIGKKSSIIMNHTLAIPADSMVIEQFKKARLEYHMAVEEDFFNQYAVTQLQRFTVKKGENIWDLCYATEDPLPMWLIQKFNKHTNLAALMPGAVIWMPVVREKSQTEIKLETTTSWRGFMPIYPDPFWQATNKTTILY